VDANHDYYIIVTLPAACTAGIPYISNNNSGAGEAWYSMAGYMFGGTWVASTNASAIIGGMSGSGIFGIQQVVVG
jgi:hypothetical protein